MMLMLMLMTKTAYMLPPFPFYPPNSFDAVDWQEFMYQCGDSPVDVAVGELKFLFLPFPPTEC